MLKVLNSSEFEKEVLEKKEVILVDFFASWCGPCQMLTPVLEKIANSRAEYNISKVNIDENIELANRYNVELVPTMLIFKEGNVVDKIVGFAEEDEIIDILSKHM